MIVRVMVKTLVVKVMANEFLLPRSLLFGLLAVYSGVILLHASQLPVWCFAICIIILLWRINILREKWQAPKALIKALLVAIVVALLFVEYQQWLSIEPMLTLLLLALTLKLIEIRHRRDFLFILFLSYFVIACSFLFNQSVLHSAFSLFVTLMTTMVLIQLNSVQLSLKKRGKLSIIMLAQSSILAVVMMLVLPRIHPLWSVPLQSGEAIVGVGDSMSPGDFDQLIRSNQLALRITFSDQDKVLTRGQMYWRGLVFDQFDGRRWQRSSPVSVTENSSARKRSTPVDRKNTGSAIQYEVLMEPTANQWLYGVRELVVNRSDSTLIYTPENEVFQTQGIHQRIKYSATSFLDVNQSSHVLSHKEYQRYTALVTNSNPQTQEKAKEWRRQTGSDQAYIQKVLDYYRQNFIYTLSPPRLGRHTADEFLFSTFQGFCEHFASSFTLLMRSAGIPARVVVGYQGGEWDTQKQYLRVYQRDAHAWSEVWLQGQGWVRVDPTAAVASIRIQQGVAAALPPSEKSLVGSGMTISYQWVNQLYAQWQVLDYRWQRWVLDYDTHQQQNILQNILGQLNATKIALFVLGVLLLVVLFMATILFRDLFKQTTQEKKLFQQLQKKLLKLGVIPKKGESIAQYCDRASTANPKIDRQLMGIKKELESILYNTHVENKESVKKSLKAIKLWIKSI